jgi:plasmid stability protein
MTTSNLSAIQKAQGHFRTKLSNQMKKYHVEEWDLDVYYRELSSLRIESKIVELAQQGKSVEALVQTIISKALDAEGKPLFTQYDKDTLMNECDPAVVLKLSRVLSGAELPSVEDVEKN